MTYFPKNLKSYPNMDSSLPLHIKINRLKNGYPSHRHDFLEFSYVIEGRGHETINGIPHPMIPGTFTFILPYQIHEIHTDPGQTLVLVNCMFSMSLLMEAGGQTELDRLLTEDEDLTSFVQLGGRDHERFCNHLHDMLDEYEGSERLRASMLRAKLTELLVLFDRKRRAGQLASAETANGSGKLNPTWRIIHYIQSHYQESLTLSDLAVKFSMSMSRISERIKEMTDLTFVQFLNDLRIRHACSLLVSTMMNITEIAYEVGYGSYKTFSRLFREQKGVVPTDYRKLRMQQAYAKAGQL
ncbi:helix-turn-helix domain-containing protein [Paenibacillus sepulcri]|uniref:AraC family transcriptional regulator n=1 Tax=Paenibacillus sepulcri TaxID=359917 RepID=A0ABS7CGE8_9BACL|nr:AraC family transcriptional regulator [Paenibacillus sepulcri]